MGKETGYLIGWGTNGWVLTNDPEGPPKLICWNQPEVFLISEAEPLTVLSILGMLLKTPVAGSPPKCIKCLS